MRRSSAKSPSRGNDKAAAIRRQRAAWLNPSDDAQPHPTEPTTGRQRHSDFRTAAGASALASAETGRRSDHLVAGSDDGEVIDEFAEQLREASAAEQREKELRKDRAMSAIRVQVLEEEISGLAQEKTQLDRQLQKIYRDDARVDAANQALDEEVARFMQSVKQRKHALACEKATIAERQRVVNEQRTDNDAQVRLIQDTLLTLRL
eukprot:m.43530 g.43530  ORF g.43530 m.43530 type:complete len:206 (+) comp8441_c0_seq1:188-805(+)